MSCIAFSKKHWLFWMVKTFELWKAVVVDRIPETGRTLPSAPKAEVSAVAKLHFVFHPSLAGLESEVFFISKSVAIIDSRAWTALNCTIPAKASIF